MNNYMPLIVYIILTPLSYIILKIIGIYIGVVVEILVGLFVILTLIIMIYKQECEEK